MAAKKMCIIIFVAFLVSVFTPPQPTVAQDQQPPYLLSNTVPRSYSSYPDMLIEWNGTVFFRAYDGKQHSIWKSDGTAEGTVKVLPGVNLNQGFFVYQNHLYFPSTDGLMRTNGEPGNIELVLSTMVLPVDFAEMNGTLYILANTRDETGQLYALYRSDGTQAGTQLIRSWRFPNQYESFVSQLAVIGSYLVFECPLETGRSLCVSDGTSGGTEILKQIGPPELTHAGYFTLWQDQLYFVGYSESEGRELWVTDGTAENTRLVVDLNPGPDSASPYYLTISGEALYFVALTKLPGDTQAERYLWKTDGTPQGTSQVIDGNNELLNAQEISFLTRAGSLLYFVTDRNALWRTDGTPEGTYRLISIGERYDVGHQLAAYQGKLYFNNYQDGKTLWVTDGTLEGTILVYEVDPRWILATSQGLFFNGDDGYHGEELWTSDGTSQGTRLVTNIVTAQTVRRPKAVIPAGDRVYMISDGSLEDPNYPNSPNDPTYRLWVSDGTPQGTYLAPSPDICSTTYFDPQFHAVIGNVLYYPGADCMIWRTDGTAAGTWKVPGSQNLDTFDGLGATVLGQRLLFFYGRELWVIEGEPEQAHLVKAVSTWMENAGIYSVTAYRGQLYFLTYTRNNSDQNQPRGNWKLWTSDGTESGTKVVHQVDIPEPIPENIQAPGAFVTANDLLFFPAYHPEKGYVLYQSDGTQAGTKIVPSQPATGLTLPLLEAGGYLYAANTIREIGFGSTPFEARYRTGLYRTRGDANGMELAVQFPDLFAYDSKEIVDITALGNRLFISFRNRLWVSDGTAAGTYMLEQGTYPANLTPVGPRVFYSAYSSGKGQELWSSDGSPQRTSMVADLRDGMWEGERSSSPTHLTRLGDRVFFAANDGIHGIQLWVYDYSYQKLFIPVTVH